MDQRPGFAQLFVLLFIALSLAAGIGLAVRDHSFFRSSFADHDGGGGSYSADPASCKSGCDSMSAEMQTQMGMTIDQCKAYCDDPNYMWGGGTGTYDSSGTDYCMEIKNNAGTVVGYEHWNKEKKTLYDTSGNVKCTSDSNSYNNGNSGGASSMQNCSYPNATYVDTGQSVGGPVLCKSDYVDCQYNGEDLIESNLSLGAPSSCENWGGGGSGSSDTCTMSIFGDSPMMGSSVTCPFDTGWSGSSDTGGSSTTTTPASTTTSTSVEPPKKRILNAAEKRALLVKEFQKRSYGDYEPCLPWELRATEKGMAWRMDDLTTYADTDQAWQKEMSIRYGVSLEEYRALEGCPEDVTPTGAGDEKCEDIERECVLLQSPKLELGQYEDFELGVATCMENKSASLSEVCTYSGSTEHARIREQAGNTCVDDDECGVRTYCNTWDYREKAPKNHPLAAQMIAGVRLGRCIHLDPGACRYDADCSANKNCEMMHTDGCEEAICLGQCRETHTAAPAVVPAEDCRQFTRKDVERRIVEEGGENTPGEIEKMYASWIEDEGYESVEAFERCDTIAQPADPTHKAAPEDSDESEGTTGTPSGRRTGEARLGRVLGGAVAMLVDLLDRADELGLSEELRSLVREGMEWFSGSLGRFASDDANVAEEIVVARGWVERISESMPDDVLLDGGHDPEESGERQTIAFGQLRSMLGEADEMLSDWIPKFLDALAETTGEWDGTEHVQRWRKVLKEAQEMFYGTENRQYSDGAMSNCGSFLAGLYEATNADQTFEGAGDQLDGCGNRVESVFAKLEKGMKNEVDQYVPDEVMQSVMQKIGAPPIGPPEDRRESANNDDNRDEDEEEDNDDIDGIDDDDDDHKNGDGDRCWNTVERVLGSARVEKMKACAAKVGCGKDDHTGQCDNVWSGCFSAVATGPEMRLLETSEACNNDDNDDDRGGPGGKTYGPEHYEGKFTVRGSFDGVTDVIVSGPKLYVQHWEFGAPENVSLDDASWNLKWGPVTTYNCKGCTSDSQQVPYAVEGKDVMVVFHNARESAYVKEHPSSWNDGKLVVRIEDRWTSGASEYSFTVYVIGDSDDGGSTEGGAKGDHPVYAQSITCEHDLYSVSPSASSFNTAPAVVGTAFCGEKGCFYKDNSGVNKGYCSTNGCTPDAETFTNNVAFSPCKGEEIDVGHESGSDHCTIRDIVLLDDGGSIGSAECDGDSSANAWCRVPSNRTADSLLVDELNFAFTKVRSHGPCDCNSDGTFSNPECPSWSGGSGGGTGGGTGGGSEEGDRCFYTNVQMSNGKYIGYTVDCTRNGTDCRYGSQSGDPIDMNGVKLGTERNCYYQKGGQPGGGGMSDMRNCWYENASRKGVPFVDTRIWCEGDYYNCHFDSPTGTVVTFDDLSLGAPSSCEGGGDSGSTGNGGSAVTGGTECVYKAYSVKSDATIGSQISESVMMNNDPNATAGGGMGPGYIGVDSGTAYAPGTVEADYTSCDCGRWENGQEQPRDGVFNDCGGGGYGGYYQSCVDYGITIRSTGQDVGEGISCGGSQFCTGVKTGKQYAPSALMWNNTWSDCDGDGQPDGDSTGGNTTDTTSQKQPLGACAAFSVDRAGLSSYPAAVPGENITTMGQGYSIIQVGQNTQEELAKECPYQMDKIKANYCSVSENTGMFRFVNLTSDPANPSQWSSETFPDGGSEHACPAAALPGRNILNSFMRLLSLQ